MAANVPVNARRAGETGPGRGEVARGSEARHPRGTTPRIKEGGEKDEEIPDHVCWRKDLQSAAPGMWLRLRLFWWSGRGRWCRGCHITKLICDQLTVSLDSADPALHDLHRGPGTHKRVVEAIRCLKEAGVKEVVVSGVITRHNQREPYRAFEKFANEIGADRAAREIYIPQGDERDPFLVPDFDALLQDMEEALEKAVAEGFEAESEAKVVWRDRCGAAYGVIAVDHEGSVYPCQGLMMPEFNAGNVSENSLGKIYEESETLAQVRGITVADIPGCRDCDFRHLCGGGCRALAYKVHRSLTVAIPEEYCAFNRLLAEGKLWAAALSA